VSESVNIASFVDVLGMLEHFKFAMNVAFFVRQEYFLHHKSGNLLEVSQEAFDIYTMSRRTQEACLANILA
jgi:hypothetical protein